MDRSNRSDRSPEAVIAAYRKGRMSPQAREAAWQRLQADIGASDESPRGRSSDRRSWGRRDAAWAAALLIAAALLLWTTRTSRVVAPEQASARDSQAAHDAVRRAVEYVRKAMNTPRANTIAAPPASSPTTPPAPLIQPAATQRPTRAADSTSSRLDAELALLRAARDALAARDAATALARLDEHARDFASGHLAEERMFLRAQALCELGRPAESRAAAEALRRAFPGSPHEASLAELCHQ